VRAEEAREHCGLFPQEESMHFHSMPVEHERMDLNDRFSFACRKELACFGSCCMKRDLCLTPYDVLRLKQALGLHSDDFLSQYTVYALDPATGFPSVSLRLNADDGRCPFLIREGCSVYRDRPTVCRMFPLARVSGFKPGSFKREEFFYLMPSGKCLGTRESRSLTVAEWLEDQETAHYREANDKMLHLLFHPKRGGVRNLNEKQLRKIIIACYDLDVFREFVFKTRFLETRPLEEDARDGIARDDSKLLDLGLEYLAETLF
jgi:hypothetical protein